MYTFKNRLLINCPPQAVFDFVTNPANASAWQNGVVSAEWTSASPGRVGSTWRVVSKMLGRKFETELEITEWDPPNRTSSKTISGPIPLKATYIFEPIDNGTQISMTSEADIGGFFKLAEGLVGKQLEKQIESDNAALKLLLEAGADKAMNN